MNRIQIMVEWDPFHAVESLHSLEREGLKIEHASQWINWPEPLQMNYGFIAS